MTQINYFKRAEESYSSLEQARGLDLVSNAFCTTAQNSCKCYLKHVVTEYCIRDNNRAEATRALKTHSLEVLKKFITESLPDFQCDWKLVIAADVYQLTAVYPRKDSFKAGKEDVDACWAAVCETHRAVMRYTENL